MKVEFKFYIQQIYRFPVLLFALNGRYTYITTYSRQLTTDELQE